MPPRPDDPPIDAEAFDAFEAAGWERAADGYHDFFAPITTRAIELLLDAAGVAAGSRVLDVASGPGYVASAAHGRGATVTGIDVAAEMVELAQRLQPDVRFLRADAQRLPFEDGTFDAALANFAILHLGRPERAAAEIARVLAPGGQVALTVWDRPERARLLGLFVDAAARAGAPAPPGVPIGPDFFRFSDDEEFAALLGDAGLDQVEVSTIAFGHRLAGGDEFWDGMLGGTVRTSALVGGQDEPTRRRIRAAFDALADEHATADGALEVPVSIKLASARKPE